jgi:hypothetical protein
MCYELEQVELVRSRFLPRLDGGRDCEERDWCNHPKRGRVEKEGRARDKLVQGCGQAIVRALGSLCCLLMATTADWVCWSLIRG